MTKHEEFGLKSAPFKTRYDNYIGGEWVAPRSGRYMPNISPVTGQVICEVARSDANDIEMALDAAHKARKARHSDQPRKNPQGAFARAQEAP